MSNFIEALLKGFLPECMQDDNGTDLFHTDDAEQCQAAMRKLLEIADRGSLFRVTFGMAVLLDPKNRCVDPDADYLEHHPEGKANEADAARWRALVNCARIRLFGWAGLDVAAVPIADSAARNYVHFGAEFWTVHPAGSDKLAGEVLTQFADAAIRAQAMPAPASTQAEVKPS